MGKIIVAQALKSCPKCNKSPNMVKLAMTHTLSLPCVCAITQMWFDYFDLSRIPAVNICQLLGTLCWQGEPSHTICHLLPSAIFYHLQYSTNCCFLPFAIFYHLQYFSICRFLPFAILYPPIAILLHLLYSTNCHFLQFSIFYNCHLLPHYIFNALPLRRNRLTLKPTDVG